VQPSYARTICERIYERLAVARRRCRYSCKIFHREFHAFHRTLRLGQPRTTIAVFDPTQRTDYIRSIRWKRPWRPMNLRLDLENSSPSRPRYRLCKRREYLGRKHETCEGRDANERQPHGLEIVGPRSAGSALTIQSAKHRRRLLGLVDIALVAQLAERIRRARQRDARMTARSENSSLP
jgi:hypothetical protein